MDAPDAHPAESRPPTVADLLLLCRSLNAHGARYLVLGGFAVNQHGFARATMGIEVFSIQGVPIPFASARLLLRTKQTHRERDAEDRMFLERKVAEEGGVS